MNWLNDSRCRPTADEEAVMFCFLCHLRIGTKSKRAATEAWTKHRNETGHDVGWIGGRIQRKKRGEE